VQKITAAEGAQYKPEAPTDPRGTTATLTRIQGTKDEIKAMEELQKLRSQMSEDALEGYARERLAIQNNFLERRKQIEQLAKAGGNKVTNASYNQSLDLNEAARDQANKDLERKRLAEETTQDLESFESRLSTTAITQSETRMEQANREYEQRVKHYHDLYDQGKLTEEKLTQLDADASQKRLQIQGKEADEHAKQMTEMAAKIKDAFATGMTDAIVDFAKGTKTAKEAFRDFAASFVEEVAKMIIKQEILNTVAAIGKALGYSGGGTATADALGGVHFAANGIQTVSSPTYFPKFNVVAGEAGREMLTVLAKPRQMSIGGMEAVVGRAGNRNLAITNADDLAAQRGGGGTGGHLVIEIQHSEQARADIIRESVQGAEVRVTKRVAENSELRHAVRKSART
jgi:phage-related minor tail protein